MVARGLANALKVSVVLYALLAGVAQDPASPPAAGAPVAAPATIAWESTERPPMRSLIDALRRTRLDGLSTRIKLDFDADGKVKDASLLESTGNENLDAAILEWARGVKLKPGAPGGAGVLPMTLMRPR